MIFLQNGRQAYQFPRVTQQTEQVGYFLPIWSSGKLWLTIYDPHRERMRSKGEHYWQVEMQKVIDTGDNISLSILCSFYKNLRYSSLLDIVLSG